MENLQGYSKDDIAIMALYANDYTRNVQLTSLKQTARNNTTKAPIHAHLEDNDESRKDSDIDQTMNADNLLLQSCSKNTSRNLHVPIRDNITVNQSMRGNRSLESIRRRRKDRITKTKDKHNINKGPEIEFSSKFKKRLSQSPYSPLPVGVVEEDILSETDCCSQASLQLDTRGGELQQNEADYASLAIVSEKHPNRALLLDPILIPVEEPKVIFNTGDLVHDSKCTQLVLAARHERNQALQVVQTYRDLAEKIQEEKRKAQDELETRVETVRNFWRNEVVEGQSRSGKILRAALFRKKDAAN
ncbi:uncharacterized protein [Dysidea avara]|uniref:uncharacterized protein isoform X2 n=1 Tax=Dysidea avara TaxID=196820 RepID=UPI003332B702